MTVRSEEEITFCETACLGDARLQDVPSPPVMQRLVSLGSFQSSQHQHSAECRGVAALMALIGPDKLNLRVSRFAQTRIKTPAAQSAAAAQAVSFPVAGNVGVDYVY